MEGKMNNTEEILKAGSKAFKLTQTLKKHASVCFEKGDDFYEEDVMSAISDLEDYFKPYAEELERIQEERKQQELKLKQICDKEGHIGNWEEEHYEIKGYMGDISDRQYVSIPQVRWVRTCTRCGKKEISEQEPEDVKKKRKKKEIANLKEKIEKLKAEL